MSAPLASRRQRGSWIPWIFVAGFGVVILVNAVLAVFATNSFSGLETEHAYNTGLAYNDILAAREEQAARGWRHELLYTPDEAGGGRFEVTFAERAGEALEGLAVVAQIRRPVHDGADQEIVLTPAGGGKYSAHLALPFKGQWSAEINAAGIGAPYNFRERFWVR